MDELTDLLTALAKFAWPTVVAVLLWKLFPAIRRVIESRSFTVKLPGGTEISVQQASNEGLRLLGDVTERVADIDARQRELIHRLEEGIEASVSEARGVGTVAPVSDQETVYLKLTPSSEEGRPPLRHAARILWMGAPTTASEIALLVEQGVDVEFVGSFERAQHLLHVTGRSYDVIISRMYKDEGGLPREGLSDEVLAEQVQELRKQAPVIFYDELLVSVASWAGWVLGLGGKGPVRDITELDRELRDLGLTVFRSAAASSATDS